MVASVDAPEDLSLQKTVTCNDQVAFKMEENVVRFFNNTTSYKKVIHCTNFSAYKK